MLLIFIFDCFYVGYSSMGDRFMMFMLVYVVIDCRFLFIKVYIDRGILLVVFYSLFKINLIKELFECLFVCVVYISVYYRV